MESWTGLPLVHPRHEWVVDLATHRISRRLCPACVALIESSSAPAPLLAAREPLEVAGTGLPLELSARH